jgi:hypothetical protein
MGIKSFQVEGHAIQAIFGHSIKPAAAVQCVGGGEYGVERGQNSGHHEPQNQKGQQDFHQGEAVAGYWSLVSGY